MTSDIDRDALSRVIALVNHKGGVLKSSIAANVGGTAAADGMRVLLVDLDPQGDLKHDLGIDPALDDGGKSIADVLLFGDDYDFTIVRDVRPNLDLICGGKGMRLVHADGDSEAAHVFARRLAQIAGDYDLVLLDCPPELVDLYDLALTAARWVLIPVKADMASLDGLLQVGARVNRIRRQDNPTLAYLGVVVAAHTPAATQVLTRIEARLDAVKDLAPMFTTQIRHSEAVAYYARERGQLVAELAHDDKAAKSVRLAKLSRKSDTAAVDDLDLPAVKSAHGVAQDYQALTDELCARISAAEQEQA